MFARESTIARLMFIIFTGGIGLVTLTTQSEFWLGVLAALTTLWAILAVCDLIVARNRTLRSSRSAFLIGLSAGVFYGFGPWSDVSKRGAMPVDAKGMSSYIRHVLPTTITLIRLSHYVRPCQRAEIQTFDRSGRPDTRIVLTGHRGFSSGVERFVDHIQRSVDPAMDAMTLTYSGPDFVVTASSLDVYFDACYLLAGLLIGGIAEFCTTLLNATQRRMAEGDRLSC
jgi:hypothetical protein